MFSFLFAFLGSGLFWILYFVVSFFIGSILIKYLAKDTYRFIMGNNPDAWPIEKFVYLCIILLNMIFWPIVVAGVITGLAFKLFFGKIVWPLFCKGVQASVSAIPNIKFEK
jgi:hypothetical protein